MAETVRSHLPPEMIKNPMCRRMLTTCLDAIESRRPIHDVIHDAADDDGTFKQFAAAVQMAPNKVTGKEFSAIDAVHDLILAIWRQQTKARRLAIWNTDPKQANQLTHDLQALRRWESGSIMIELELAHQGTNGG